MSCTRYYYTTSLIPEGHEYKHPNLLATLYCVLISVTCRTPIPDLTFGIKKLENTAGTPLSHKSVCNAYANGHSVLSAGWGGKGMSSAGAIDLGCASST